MSGRRRRGALALGLALLVGFAGFAALGTWQIERREWKHALIARVEARARSAPGEPPPPADWPTICAERDEYRRVRIAGTFRNDRETLVQAVTERGPGFWVMTPLRDPRIGTVMVNRGFVPADRAGREERREGLVEGPTEVTGLLRLSEPGGGFLRANDPAGDRWFSRDVAAIAAARGLEGPLAPYFVDADARPNPGGLPIGGMTVLSFRDNHLVYALTWYALALMSAAFALVLIKPGWAARLGMARSDGEG